MEAILSNLTTQLKCKTLLGTNSLISTTANVNHCYYNFRKTEARAAKARQSVHGLRGGRRAAVARNRHGDFLVVQKR